MKDPNLPLLETAARILRPVLDDLVFVGGSMTGLLITDPGSGVRVVTPVYFVATKLEAFHGRGQGDYAASHDLEDVVTVVDGRSELVQEVRAAEADVRGYIASEVARLLSTRSFTDALPGFLLPDDASQQRLTVVRRRLEELVAA